MGGSQSRSPEQEEKIFERPSNVQFSQGFVNHLADNLASNDVPHARQESLDARVRERIDSEASRLRQQEQVIEREIVQALDQSSLLRSDRFTAQDSADDLVVDGKVRSSFTLQQDMDQIEQKVDHYQSRRELRGVVEVMRKADTVASCYKEHSAAPLDCWHQVEDFKSAVASLEQEYLDSVR